MELIYIQETSWKTQCSLPYANEDNYCKLWIKWENKKTKRCPRCARGTCSHTRRPYTEYESGTARAHVEVDISLCLKWPSGTIRASPTQIKNTQLEALLKAILCSRKIGIKLPGSQPLSEKQRQVCLDMFPTAPALVYRRERRNETGSVPLSLCGTIRVSRPSKSFRNATHWFSL